jgi:hypothetical protein
MNAFDAISGIESAPREGIAFAALSAREEMTVKRITRMKKGSFSESKRSVGVKECWIVGVASCGLRGED